MNLARRQAEAFRIFYLAGLGCHAQECQDMMKRELSPADEKEAQSRLAFAQQRLNEQKQVMDFYERTKSDFERGAISDLGKAARDLTQKTHVFTEKDPRKKQLLDLAAALEKRQRAVNAKAYARTFFNNGDMYYRLYDFDQAIGQYAEGLRAMRENGDLSDPDYTKYYKLWEDSIAKDRRFKELYNYAAGLAMTDKPLDEATLQAGISAAEDALKIRPRNGDMEIHWNKLKWKLGELQRGQKETQRVKEAADKLWQEGTSLYDQKKPVEALKIFNESLKQWPDTKRQEYVKSLEDAMAQNRANAKRLRSEGEALQSKGMLAEAVTKYRESLNYWLDKQLEEHIIALKTRSGKNARKSSVRQRQSVCAMKEPDCRARGF